MRSSFEGNLYFRKFIFLNAIITVLNFQDVNIKYRKSETKATTMGSLVLFGFNMEIARILNNIITSDAFIDDETSNDVLLSSAINILQKFPDIAKKGNKNSGKALIHVI